MIFSQPFILLYKKVNLFRIGFIVTYSRPQLLPCEPVVSLLRAVKVFINTFVCCNNLPDLNACARNPRPSSCCSFGKDNTLTPLHSHCLIKQFICDNRKLFTSISGYLFNFFQCFFLNPYAFLNCWHSTSLNRLRCMTIYYIVGAVIVKDLNGSTGKEIWPHLVFRFNQPGSHISLG